MHSLYMHVFDIEMYKKMYTYRINKVKLQLMILNRRKRSRNEEKYFSSKYFSLTAEKEESGLFGFFCRLVWRHNYQWKWERQMKKMCYSIGTISNFKGEFYSDIMHTANTVSYQNRMIWKMHWGISSGFRHEWKLCRYRPYFSKKRNITN